MGDMRPLLDGGERLADEQEWAAAADATGLSPYVCKASFVCGLAREFMASSGLLLGHGLHLGALFLALDATELLGRCMGGNRGNVNAGKRLEKGLEHLEQLRDPALPDLSHDPSEYKKLRNFTGHGATSLEKNLRFGPDATNSLLRRLSHALNRMWSDEEVQVPFARAEVFPLTTVINGKLAPVYIMDVQELLARGTPPGDNIDHEESWRGVFYIDPSSPATTGR